MTPETALAWLEFCACATVIVAAGTRLSVLGDSIATMTGLGGNLVGLVLLSVVTSLPELFTGASAVLFAGVPDIAIGDLLGASMLVLAMVAVLDALNRDKSLYVVASPRHVITAAFATAMLASVAWGVAFPAQVPAFGRVGATTPLLIMLYALAIATVYRSERAASGAAPAIGEPRKAPLRPVASRFAIVATVVVAAAIWLPFAADRLAGAMAWNDAFIGTAFVAIATTLPEIAVTVGAIRVGALDLATGNLLGSVLFDLVLVAVNDVLHAPGPILGDVASAHAVTALCAALMAAAVLMGIRYRVETRWVARVGPVSAFVVLVYVLGLWMISRGVA